MVGLIAEEKNTYSSSCKIIFPCLIGLGLMLSCFVASANNGGGEPLSKTFDHYQRKVSDHQGSNPLLARQYADSMLLSAKQAEDTLGLANAMKVIGDLDRDTGNFAKAVLWYHPALSLASVKQNQELAVRIHNNLGGVYLKTANYDKALTQYNRAYSLGRNTLTPLQKATLLNNLGLVYRHTRQYSQSKIYTQEALDIYIKEDNAVGLGQVYNNLGVLAQKMGNFDESLQYYTQALTLSESINRPTGVAYAASNLATLYLDVNDPQQALLYLHKAYKLKLTLDDKLGLLNAHSSLGRAWLQLSNADSAIYHCQAASLYADSVENVDKKIEALLGLAEAYKLKGDNSELSMVYPWIVSLKDSSFNLERAGQLAIAQSELEMTQKENAIQELTAEAVEASDKLRSRELVLLVSLQILILLALFAIFYVRRFRSERRAHRQLLLHHEEIRQQKEKIEQQHQTIRQQNLELQGANKLIEHYNGELESLNEQLEDKIRERTRALMDTYKKLSFHINNTPLAVLEWNKHLALVRWPEQAEKIFGYKAQQVLGQTADHLPFMQNDQHQQFLDAIRQGDTGLQTRQLSFQQELKKANGDAAYVEWSHSVLTDDEGRLESVLSIANDVSLREKAFHEISFINQELDTFIYKASHDLRGPIARMQGIINLGKIESSDPQALFYFDLLNKVSAELHNLLMRLLMVHNIFQNTLEVEPIQLHDFAGKLIDDLPARERVQNFSFHNHIPKELRISSDKNLLNIILVNLLDNSLTYADNDKPVMLITASVLPDNKLSICVQDNGPGIVKNLQEKVFDMFFKGSTKSVGMGLGLYMVRKAVRRLGGQVKLEHKDALTTFTVVLPASELMTISKTTEKMKVPAL